MFRKKRKKTEIKERKEIKETRKIEKVAIKTNEFTKGTSIKIFFPNREEDNIWLTSVDKRLKPYSESQIRRIWSDCQNQIKAMDPEIPVVFHEIVRKLNEAIKKRGIDI